MLIVTRKEGESLYIGDGIKVQVLEVEGSRVKIGIKAPSDVPIDRHRKNDTTPAARTNER